jgi:SUN domain-containing protein 1/2
MTAGHCWPLVGTSGVLAVKLTQAVRISAITVDHLPKELATTRNPASISPSAPRHFKVYGLRGETEADLATRMLLGTFEYDAAGPQTQTFHLLPHGQSPSQTTPSFPVAQLEVVDNYGNQKYTCIYRFRVHGLPA